MRAGIEGAQEAVACRSFDGRQLCGRGQVVKQGAGHAGNHGGSAGALEDRVEALQYGVRLHWIGQGIDVDGSSFEVLQGVGVAGRYDDQSTGPARPCAFDGALQLQGFLAQPAEVFGVVVERAQYEGVVGGAEVLDHLGGHSAPVKIDQVDPQPGRTAAADLADAPTDYKRKEYGDDEQAGEVAPLREEDLQIVEDDGQD